MKIPLIWTAVVGAVLMGQSMMGGVPSSMWNPAAAVIVFLPCGIFLILSIGLKDWWKFLERCTRQKLNDLDAAIIDRCASLGVVLGGVSAILGLVHVFEHISDSRQLGQGMSMLITSLLYGFMLYLLTLPLTAQSKGEARRSSKSAGIVAVSVSLMLLSVFVVLYVLKS